MAKDKPQLKDPTTPEAVLQRVYGMGKNEAIAVAKRIENASALVQAFKQGGAAVQEIIAKSNAYPPVKFDRSIVQDSKPLRE